MVRVGVLALQGAFLEHVQVLARLGVEVREVRLPADLAAVDALIIPGGESTTIGKLMVRFGLDGPIRERAQGGMPVWGTCAGMILLARDIGGLQQPLLGLMDVVVERNAFGRQVDSFEEPVQVPALGPTPFPAVFIRAPLIHAVGDDVEVLARLDDDRVVAARQGTLLATAFHPELTGDDRLHRYFLSLTGDARHPRPPDLPTR